MFACNWFRTNSCLYALKTVGDQNNTPAGHSLADLHARSTGSPSRGAGRAAFVSHYCLARSTTSSIPRSRSLRPKPSLPRRACLYIVSAYASLYSTPCSAFGRPRAAAPAPRSVPPCSHPPLPIGRELRLPPAGDPGGSSVFLVSAALMPSRSCSNRARRASVAAAQLRCSGRFDPGHGCVFARSALHAALTP
jgi:hypothetical protein